MMTRSFIHQFPCRAAFGAALAILLLAACPTKAPEPAKKTEEAPPAAEKKQEPAPAAEPAKPDAASKPEEKKLQQRTAKVFKVRFETTKGDFVMEVHKDWAPTGAARFEELVKAGYFDNSSFFRVVPNFVIQFGLAASPAATATWDKSIKDDPVTQTNRVGSVTFATAGPNTRTSQLFINLRSNTFLDEQGFSPFAQVTEGMEVIAKINAEYGELPDQGAIRSEGNTYLKKFPRLDYIKKATIEF